MSRAPIILRTVGWAEGCPLPWSMSMRVIGVEGLRVADSSIFPQVTNGNLNGPSIMTGEKAADHILGRKLARSNLQPVINENWRVSQR